MVITKEHLKIAAFGAMGAAFVGLAFVMSGSNGLLDGALKEIKLAQTEIKGAQTNIVAAKITIDSAQQVLGVLRLAAETTKKDLDILRGQREKIHSDIANTIANSKQDLKKYGNSIQELLNEQNQTINSLDSLDIRTLIVVPAKK